ncbi:MAG: alpha/beta fold hydrolase [SAR324 cluster bacterium]|nr:alpha/beta fold hydrolase [SAR324 cluster bacterium]MBL7035402.1 alpha/beta fold hydrolase [SAR324 cluster bacterium]
MSLNKEQSTVNEAHTSLATPLQNPELEGASFYWEGGKIGILLIHGFTATTAEVRPLAKRFNEAGYTVSAVLLPGHGTTPENLNKTSYTDWVTASERAYFELKKKCTHIFVGGESAGAVLALHLASEHPEIKGLLLYAPAMRLASSLLRKFVMVLASPFVFAIQKESGKTKDEMEWQGYKVNPLKAGVQLLRLQWETKPRLSRIYQPVLIIQANLDQTVDLKSGEIILQRIQSAVRESHWMEQSGHVVILDQEFEEVADISLKFIRKLKLT